ncbi:hypothetical protein EDB85DRAFT_1890948 [Lactarius pseudohatsudake]|nr:hypothetical protein EDB85DRAFT_1890948 [Lactarius pseudohatsudake]
MVWILRWIFEWILERILEWIPRWIHLWIQIIKNKKAEQTYQKNLAQKAVLGHPREDILYAILIDFLALHQVPLRRFTIYPQMNLKWNPADHNDRRFEIPDFGLVNFTSPNTNPPFKLRCGVEVKRSLEIMSNLPPPVLLTTNYTVMTLFHCLYFQAQTQAKAAYKNSYPLTNDGVQWILVVGPYWLPKIFGPFSEAELGVRNKHSDNADIVETTRLIQEMNKPPPELEELYLLGTLESYNRLEGIIASTDELAKPFIDGYTFSYG